MAFCKVLQFRFSFELPNTGSVSDLKWWLQAICAAVRCVLLVSCVYRLALTVPSRWAGWAGFVQNRGSVPLMMIEWELHWIVNAMCVFQCLQAWQHTICVCERERGRFGICLGSVYRGLFSPCRAALWDSIRLPCITAHRQLQNSYFWWWYKVGMDTFLSKSFVSMHTHGIYMYECLCILYMCSQAFASSLALQLWDVFAGEQHVPLTTAQTARSTRLAQTGRKLWMHLFLP